MNTIILAILALISLTISFFKDKQKTIKALKKALSKFKNIAVQIILMVIFVSIVLYIIPEDVISKYISSSSKLFNVFIASIIGSITLIPGFIAFPLSAILKNNGITYMVISSFTTTLMMVGILTFPIEKQYFGFKVSLIRNIISFIIALIVSLFTGILYGEIFI